MSDDHWSVIGILAVAAFSICVLGLVTGRRILASRYAWPLDELPGPIVVSLVASSLAGKPTQTGLLSSPNTNGGLQEPARMYPFQKGKVRQSETSTQETSRYGYSVAAGAEAKN